MKYRIISSRLIVCFLCVLSLSSGDKPEVSNWIYNKVTVGDTILEDGR